MATVEECEQALDALADRLAANDPARRKTALRPQPDLHASATSTSIFAGRLKDGQLIDIRTVRRAAAPDPARR